MAHLLNAVPDERRGLAFAQLPFDVDTFPLASSPQDLVDRRAAQVLFLAEDQTGALGGRRRSGD